MKTLREFISFVAIATISFLMSSAIACIYMDATMNVNGGLCIAVFGGLLLVLAFGGFDDKDEKSESKK